MHKAVMVLPDAYFDSVVLMGAASKLKAFPGVTEAAFFMGTEANKVLLANVGLRLPEVEQAGTGDTVLAVEAEDADAARAALDEARDLLLGKRRAAGEGGGPTLPHSLGSALRQREDADLAVISLPGAYVEAEALRALTGGLHVFIFSDNVPLEAEVRLKTEAVRRGLLCMGPDCGTAWINGVGIGFSNAVPRGRVGLISASGTGAQAVACRLAELGEGLSQGIGVGGRDLSREVGGAMTLQALRMLQADPATEAIIVISKPPHPEVLPRVQEALRAVTKPVVMAVLGTPWPESDQVFRAGGLAEAAEVMVARLHPEREQPRFLPFADMPGARALLETLPSPSGPLLGLFVGGTLAHEADLVIAEVLGAPVAYGDEAALGQGRHAIIDLGDDTFTQGRPHPMIEPQLRNDYLGAVLPQGLGVVVFDVVLGRCSNPDPAGVFARAVRAAREARPDLSFIGSVVGTSGDSQNLAGQIAALRQAGAVILPDNAQAARLAALLVAPAAVRDRCLGRV